MRTMLSAPLALMLLAGPGLAQSTDPVCQAAWDRIERLRVELGLRPSQQEPIDPSACATVLALPEQDLRESIGAIVKICRGNCLDPTLIPEALVEQCRSECRDLMPEEEQ